MRAVQLYCILIVTFALVISWNAVGQGAAPAGASQPASFDLSAYTKVLAAFVDDQGGVNYAGLKAQRSNLDAFVLALGALAPTTYTAWPDTDKIAFWLNAYNALTLQSIIDHYPIQSSLLKSLLYPKNSIRQISGVWDTAEHAVMGQKLTLDAIEHQVLRKQFSEPRIHAALVCAARGCPPLRNEPYRGATLDEQLKDQLKRFVSNPQKFRIDRGKNVVYLSSIFKWFGADFVARHGTSEGFSGHSDAERAVLHLISSYLPEADRSYLATGTYSVSYLDYDWTLNEQAGK